MPSHQSQRFVVTNFNLETDYAAMIAAPGSIFRFIAAGRETCPTTGREHDQAFVYLHKRKATGARTLKQLGAMFGPKVAHVEDMRGSFYDNEVYCSKEAQLQKFGRPPVQGARGDLEETKEAILAGHVTPTEIMKENLAYYHQYGRTFKELHSVAMRQRFRTQHTKGIWYTGAAGAGKSTHAYENFSPETHYVKNLKDEWWDGYAQQKYVVFNEFRGQIDFAELMDLVDKWPKTVKIRNQEPVPFTSEFLIITSNLSPGKAYEREFTGGVEDWGQFTRRFKVIDLVEGTISHPTPPISRSKIPTVFRDVPHEMPRIDAPVDDGDADYKEMKNLDSTELFSPLKATPWLTPAAPPVASCAKVPPAAKCSLKPALVMAPRGTTSQPAQPSAPWLRLVSGPLDLRPNI